MRKKFLFRLGLAGLLAAVATMPAAVPAEAQNKIRIGFILFLSGPAASAYGLPARNAAELMIASFQSGSVPSPYDGRGIAGAQIEPVWTDENSERVVADYRHLVQKEQVDLVIGPVSSGSCNKIAPVAEKLKRLTIFSICGTPQVFEDIVEDPHYVFRTAAHGTMDNVAAARYLVGLDSNVSSISGVNPDYSWGRDSWRDFSAAMEVLKPGAVVGTKHFPELWAGEYGAEIAALLLMKPEATHSSLWGDDLETFIRQGASLGLFAASKVILTTGEAAIHSMGRHMPDGTIVGGRGSYGYLAPDSELDRWFKKAYSDRFGALPSSSSYAMAQAMLAVKIAFEMAAERGAAWPDQENVISALEGLVWEAPAGRIEMSLARGHQAIQGTAYGMTKYDPVKNRPTVVEVRRYKAECVNPPPGMKSSEWIKSGFKGAEC